MIVLVYIAVLALICSFLHFSAVDSLTLILVLGAVIMLFGLRGR